MNPVFPTVGRPEPPAAAAPARAGATTDRDWDWRWEGLRAGGKLYLFCYLRDTVVAVPPLDFDR